MRRRLARFAVFIPGLSMGVVTLLLSRPENGGPAGPLLALLVLLYLASLLLFRAGVLLPAGLVLGLGLLMRLPLIAAPPVLSDDIYRYVWDGRVTRSGENPFRYGPLADELSPLRDSDWQRINHPELPTIYPPAAQAIFAAAGQVVPGITGLKALFVLFDFGIALLIARTVARAQGDRWKLPLYWWHPLPVVEFAWSGHVDVVGLFCLVVALKLADSGERRNSLIRSAGAGVALAGASLVKFLALPAAPFLAGRRWKETLAGFLVAAAIFYAPFFGAGVNVLGSLGTYLTRWRANDVFFGMLLRPGTAVDQEFRLTEAKLYALALLTGVVALVAVLRIPRARAVTIVLGSAILLSPTIHPWYVAWLVPFLAFGFSASWFFVTLIAFLAYHPAAAGPVGADGWLSWPVRAVVLAPFVVLVSIGLRREFFRRPAARGDSAAEG